MKLTEDMRRVVQEQKLGFVATVCPDGTPNLSPKATFRVWDDDRLVFAEIRSPVTASNLRRNPAVEVNFVDAFRRKGYRFKGRGAVLTEGPLFEELRAAYQQDYAGYRIRGFVVIDVEQALPVTSPAYDLGQTEEAILAQWRAYWGALNGLEVR